MDKEEFERRWKNADINFTDHFLIYIRGNGYIRATRYEWYNDCFIKFYYDVSSEYIEVGAFDVSEIKEIMRD